MESQNSYDSDTSEGSSVKHQNYSSIGESNVPLQSTVADNSDERPVKKGKVYLYLSLSIFALLNAFIAPLISPKFGLLTMFLQPGGETKEMVHLAIVGLPIALFEFLVAAIAFALISRFFFKHLKNFWQLFWLALLFLVIAYAFRLASFQFLVKSVDNSQYKEATNNGQAKSYDFSKKNSLIGTSNAKDKISITGSSVAWVEHTKEAFKNPRNEWDIFIFSFDQKASTGRVTKVSDLSNKKSGSVEKLLAVPGGVYWIEGTDLYFQSSDKASKELIKTNVAVVHGAYKDELLLEYSTEDTGYGAIRKGLYLYNATNKTEKNLEKLNAFNVGKGDYPGGEVEAKMSGGRIVYVVETNNLRRKIALYDIEQDTIEIVIDAEKDPNIAKSLYGKSVILDGFSGDFIQYQLWDTKDPNSVTIQTKKIFKISKKVDILEGEEISGKLIDDKLYNLNDNIITYKDLSSGKDGQYKINTTDKILNWVKNDNFIAYHTRSDSAGDQIWLEPLHE